MITFFYRLFYGWLRDSSFSATVSLIFSVWSEISQKLLDLFVGIKCFGKICNDNKRRKITFNIRILCIWPDNIWKVCSKISQKLLELLLWNVSVTIFNNFDPLTFCIAPPSGKKKRNLSNALFYEQISTKLMTFPSAPVVGQFVL